MVCFALNIQDSTEKNAHFFLQNRLFPGVSAVFLHIILILCTSIQAGLLSGSDQPVHIPSAHPDSVRGVPWLDRVQGQGVFSLTWACTRTFYEVLKGSILNFVIQWGKLLTEWILLLACGGMARTGKMHNTDLYTFFHQNHTLAHIYAGN